MFKQVFANEDGSVKPWVTYAIVAIVVIGGGYFLYAAWTGGDGPLPATLMCAKCGAVQTRQMELGESPPLKCPKCGEMAVYSAFSCRKCKAPNIYNENRGLPPPTKCVKCGQENRHGS